MLIPEILEAENLELRKRVGQLEAALRAADEWFQKWVNYLPPNEPPEELIYEARGVIEFIYETLGRARGLWDFHRTGPY